MKHRQGLVAATIAAGALLAAGALRAQDDDPLNRAAQSPPGVSPENSERIVINGVPPEQSILPTARPLTSVYGTEQNIVDIPRDVSTITKEQVEFRQITSVSQLGQFASGTYSASIFGAESLPQIRGVTAELFQNGQRIKYYNPSFPPSFNGAESIDVVKGPGTAVYGPPSVGLGGYVNLVTKQPFFDGQHLEITSVLGDLYGGGSSYGRYQWQVDNGGPLIKDQLAYRVSYLGRESSGYYRNVSNNVEDVFAALVYFPTKELRFDLTGQYYESKFNEVAGFNRVTQDLIDNNTYVAGPITPGYAPFVGVVTPGADGTYNGQRVTLHNDQVLVHPGDSAAGSRFLGQLITTLTLDGLTIKNSTYGETTESRKFSAYGFTEYAPSNITFENRTEFQFELDTPVLSARRQPKLEGDGKDKGAYTEGGGLTFKHHFDAGVSFRYEHTRAYSALINEPFAVYDVSGNGPTPVFSRQLVFGPERTIPGKPGYYASDLLNQAIVSDFYQGGIFLQDNVEFTPWLSAIFGLRGDFIAAKSGAPALGPLVDPAADLGSPGDPTASLGATRRDTKVVANGSYFASLIYKPTKSSSLYLTYDRVNGINSANNQGAIPFQRHPDGSTYVAENDLKLLSELYEGGAKVSLFRDTLFLSAAGYHQNRFLRDQIGNTSAIVARGADVDLSYQPNKNFSLTANFTWEAANYKAATPYSQTGNYLDTFAAGVNVDGSRGTGVGSPNYNVLPRGNYRLPDVPNVLFNAFAVYKLDCGLGAGIGPQVTGDVNVNTQGTLVIPAQVTWNAFVFYQQPHYEVRLSVFNFTDARNFTPPSTFANNDLVSPDLPIHLNATFKLRF